MAISLTRSACSLYSSSPPVRICICLLYYICINMYMLIYYLLDIFSNMLVHITV